MEATALTIDQVRYVPPGADELVEVTLQVRRGDMEALHRWMHRDTLDEARAVRDADANRGIESLAVLLNQARRHLGTSGGRVCATLLASMYNGFRVKFDASDFRSLDSTLFEHAINAIRLCQTTRMEPHQFFKNGGQLFEQMISDWGLEKKRKGTRS